MEVLGVLSGIGHLPVEVARSAKSLGYEVIAVGVVPDIDNSKLRYIWLWSFYYSILCN